MAKTNSVAQIQKLLKDCLPVAIAGGPVLASPKAASTLWLLPVACAGAANIVWMTSKEAQSKVLYALPPDAVLDPLAESVEIEKRLAKLGACTTLELLAVDETDLLGGKDDKERGGGATFWKKLRAASRFRIEGTVQKGGAVELTRCFPKANADAWRAALAILELVRATSHAWARDETEALAIVELTKTAGEFAASNPYQAKENVVKQSGREIRVNASRRPFLAQLALAARFPSGPWNFRLARDLDAEITESNRKNDELMRRAMGLK